MPFFPFSPTIGNIVPPLPVAQGGTGAITAALGFAALAPLTTAGDLIIENATPAPARLPIGAVGQGLGVSAGGLPTWLQDLYLQGTTGVGGYTLVNGTGNIFQFTTPNDGAMHRYLVLGALHVTSAETGGTIQLQYTTPDTVGAAVSVWGSGNGLGVFNPTTNALIVAKANTTITLAQTVALSAGAAVLFAEVWGS